MGAINGILMGVYAVVSGPFLIRRAICFAVLEAIIFL